MGTFSERNGYDRPDAEITIRADPPPAVREAPVMVATGLDESQAR